MSFYWPHAFWFLALPLLGVYLELRRRRAQGSAVTNKIIRAEAGPKHLSLTSTLAFVAKPRLRWRLWLGLAIAVVAVARPQWGHLEEPVYDQSREIIIAVDLSRSMLADDIKPSRLERSKLLITSLLEKLEGERVGLIVFSGTAFLQSPLSGDYEILREFLPALKPDYLPEGGTNYKAMLETATTAFGEVVGADRFLIILSDGEAQTDDWKPSIDEIKKKGIRVIGLGVGTANGAMLPDGAGGLIKDERGAVVLSKLESGTLIELANETGGTYADASTWIDLAELIKKTVDTGKRGQFREESRVRLAERFQWALAPALLLLAWSFWREFPARPRVREIVRTGKKAEAPRGQTVPPIPPNVAAAITLGLLFAAFTFSPIKGRAAEDATAQPLSKLVGDLSGRPTLAARDYAELAQTTITYGQREKSAQRPFPEGTVHDGLTSVDEGSALDAKAADWPKLRSELEKLLEKDDQQKQQQQKQQDKKDDKQDQKENQDQKNQQNSGNSPNQNQNSKPDQNKQQDKSKSQSDQEKKSDPSQSDQSKKDGQKNDANKQQKSQDAFGNMKDQKDKAQQPQPASSNPNDFQQVGGTPQKKDGEKPKDPALTIPLQKLDQLRDEDSPARLYQLMQNQQAKPAPKGKDW